MGDYPKTRSEAMSSGAKYYFTGKPCRRGHVDLRLTKGECVSCKKEDAPKHLAARRKKPKSEAAKKAGQRYYEKNKEVVKAKANNRRDEDKRAYRQRWKNKNPDLVRAHIEQKRARLRRATPKRLNKEHRRQMRFMFVKAREMTRNTGITYSVDHVIPLAGEGVCGLHVPWNLQIIPLLDNCRKSTSWSDD
jgi:hypothetical protein